MPAATAGLAARMAAKNKEERTKRKQEKRRKAQMLAKVELASLQSQMSSRADSLSTALDFSASSSMLMLDVDMPKSPDSAEEATPLPDEDAGRHKFSFSDLGISIESNIHELSEDFKKFEHNAVHAIEDMEHQLEDQLVNMEHQLESELVSEEAMIDTALSFHRNVSGCAMCDGQWMERRLLRTTAAARRTQPRVRFQH